MLRSDKSRLQGIPLKLTRVHNCPPTATQSLWKAKHGMWSVNVSRLIWETTSNLGDSLMQNLGRRSNLLSYDSRTVNSILETTRSYICPGHTCSAGTWSFFRSTFFYRSTFFRDTLTLRVWVKVGGKGHFSFKNGYRKNNPLTMKIGNHRPAPPLYGISPNPGTYSL